MISSRLWAPWQTRVRSQADGCFVLGPCRTFQIANAYLDAATSYGFGALKTPDPLKKPKQHAPTALSDDLCLHIRHQDS
jgi:hypothetical protein